MLGVIAGIGAAFGLLFALVVLLYPPYWGYYLAAFAIWFVYACVKNRRKSDSARR
jgi:phage shock protein PspC (stress-responsive transcriptional regulator)